jgi:hypothetical protein
VDDDGGVRRCPQATAEGQRGREQEGEGGGAGVARQQQRGSSRGAREGRRGRRGGRRTSLTPAASRCERTHKVCSDEGRAGPGLPGPPAPPGPGGRRVPSLPAAPSPPPPPQARSPRTQAARFAAGAPSSGAAPGFCGLGAARTLPAPRRPLPRGGPGRGSWLAGDARGTGRCACALRLRAVRGAQERPGARVTAAAPTPACVQGSRVVYSPVSHIQTLVPTSASTHKRGWRRVRRGGLQSSFWR